MSAAAWLPFEYERSTSVYRPLAPVNLKYGRNHSDRVGSLVDSGSQDTIFHMVIAQELGVPTVLANRTEIRIGGEILTAYRSHVHLQIDGTSDFIKMEAFFAEGLVYSGILGDKFFQQYHVRLERSTGHFYIRRNPILK